MQSRNSKLILCPFCFLDKIDSSFCLQNCFFLLAAHSSNRPVILGLVLVMSRIYTHLALPSSGFHSLMAAPRISSVLSSLVLFDTHKATTKTVRRHFLTEKTQNDYNFGSSVWLYANGEQPLTLFRLEVWQ